METIIETNVPQRVATDPHRPHYHFLPPSNWLNDPNGLIHWKGQYHLFYQYNPNGPFHGTIHWGHAVSADLVHWRHLPVALAPEPGTADEDGCWSGCAVDDGGVPTLIYSGNRGGAQRACLATSADGLISWAKYPGNPVVAMPPPGLNLIEYRDHCVWREDGEWLMLIGTGIVDAGGAVLLYRSTDLRNWEYLHPFALRHASLIDPLWTGPMWECPDFFALGDRHALIISVWDNHVPMFSVLMLGDYHQRRLTPQQIVKADYGDRYFYAPQTLRDALGRRIVFGWIGEGRNEQAQRERGWSGVMSLPRELTLGSDGQPRWRAIAELEQLRGAHLSMEAITAHAGDLVELPTVRGDVLELIVTLAIDPDASGGLLLRRSPDGDEQTGIFYDAARGELLIDRSRSSLAHDLDVTPQRAPLALEGGEPLRLRIFLDRSVIEVFANERVAMTSRIYPTRPDSQGVALTALSGETWIERLDGWQLSL